MVPRTISSYSTCALVVISPATTATPVVTSVSQATRPLGSCFMTASRTAAEIWSAILCGWPSVTDSDVNRKLRKASLKLILLQICGGQRFQTPLSIQHSAKPYEVIIREAKNQRMDSKWLIRAANGRNQASKGNFLHSLEDRLGSLSVVVGLDVELSLGLFGHEVGADKRIQIAVHDTIHVADFKFCPVVLDEAVRLHDVGPDLTAKGNVQLAFVELVGMRLAFFNFFIVQAWTKHLHGHLPILTLAALGLAGP